MFSHFIKANTEIRDGSLIDECYQKKRNNYWGKCGAKMIGSSAKSGKHFYYACHNYIKKGKNVCDTRFINKKEIETLIISNLKTHVFTEGNLSKLLKIIKQEKKGHQEESVLQIQTLEKQLETLQAKLDKLY